VIPGLLALLRPIFGDCRSSDACRFRRDVEGLHERYGPFDDVMLRQAVAAVMLWRRLVRNALPLRGELRIRQSASGDRPWELRGQRRRSGGPLRRKSGLSALAEGPLVPLGGRRRRADERAMRLGTLPTPDLVRQHGAPTLEGSGVGRRGDAEAWSPSCRRRSGNPLTRDARTR